MDGHGDVVVGVPVAGTTSFAADSPWHSAVLAEPEGLLSAVARAIECELPAALGLPHDSGAQLAQAALEAIKRHMVTGGALDHHARHRARALVNNDPLDPADASEAADPAGTSDGHSLTGVKDERVLVAG